MLEEVDKINNQIHLTGYSFGDGEEYESLYYCGSKMNIKNASLSAIVTRLSHVNETSININKELNNYEFISTVNEVVIIEISFSYDYSCVFSGSGTGRLVIEASNYELIKTFQFGRTPATAHQLESIFVKLSFDFDKITEYKLSGYYDNNEKVNTMGLTILERLICNKFKDIAELFENSYNEYYKDKLNNVIFVNTTFPKRLLGIDYGYGHEPKVTDNGEGLIMFHDGGIIDVNQFNLPLNFLLKMNRHERKQQRATSKINELTKLSKDSSHLSHPTPYQIWDDFNKTDGTYQIFLNSFMINDIARHLSDDAKFDFNLASKDLPKHLDFKLDIESLSKVYPGILSDYPSDDNIECDGYFNNFDIDVTNEILGSFDAHLKFTDGDAIVFVATLQMDFQLNYIIAEDTHGNLTLDFLIDKPITTKNCVIDSSYFNVNKNILLEMVTQVFSRFIQEKRWIAFSKPLKIPGFSKINKVELIKDHGLLIAGNHINTIIS